MHYPFIVILDCIFLWPIIVFCSVCFLSFFFFHSNFVYRIISDEQITRGIKLASLFPLSKILSASLFPFFRPRCKVFDSPHRSMFYSYNLLSASQKLALVCIIVTTFNAI